MPSVSFIFILCFSSVLSFVLSNSGVHELEINFLPTHATSVFYVAVQSEEPNNNNNNKKKKKKFCPFSHAPPQSSHHIESHSIRQIFLRSSQICPENFLPTIHALSRASRSSCMFLTHSTRLHRPPRFYAPPQMTTCSTLHLTPSGATFFRHDHRILVRRLPIYLTQP
jgi:hypothetical protein